MSKDKRLSVLVAMLVLVVVAAIVTRVIDFDEARCGPQKLPPPAWSPDGSRIAYAAVCDGNLEIFVIYADGSRPTRLTDNETPDSGPAWSPGGTRIAYVSDPPPGFEGPAQRSINVMGVDGSDRLSLTSGSSDIATEWSSDGGQIAFVRLVPQGDSSAGDIYVVNADGSFLTRLTDGPADDTGPTWSPDGARLAFMSMRSGNRDIYTIDADGSALTKLTDHSAQDRRPTWSPDGSKDRLRVGPPRALGRIRDERRWLG